MIEDIPNIRHQEGSAHFGGNLLCVWFSVVVFGLSAVCSPGYAIENTKKYHILHINSYHPGYDWSDRIEEGIADRFGLSGKNIELFIEYLDSVRFSKKDLMLKNAVLMRSKYAAYRFDLIIVSDNAAFDFVVKNRKLLFPGIPVVFCGYNYFRKDILKGMDNITGVNEQTDVPAGIDTALKIQPTIKNLVFILSTKGTTRKRIAREVEADVIPQYTDRYNVIVLKDVSIRQIQDELSGVPQESALFILGLSNDWDNRLSMNPVENARLICNVSPIPAYTLWDFHLGTGVLGGRVLNGYDQGKAAADMALQVLNGKNINDIPVRMESPARFIFDYAVMRHFKIQITDLPDNSEMINRPHSFYRDHKRLFWATLLCFLVLVGFIIILCLNIIRRKRVENELKDHRDNLEMKVKERTVDLVKSNADLAASEERFRALSDASFEGIVITENAKIIAVNRAVREMFEYSAGEAIGKDATEFLSADARDDAKNKVRAQYEKTYETLGVKKDGSTFPIEARARNFSYQGRQVRVTAVRDLSEQKKAERLLKDSEKMLLEAQKLARVGHYVLDMSSGFWTSSSELDKIFGIDKDFIKNVEGWKQIVHPDYREEMVAYLQDRVFKKHRSFNSEYKIINLTSQEELWVHGRGEIKFDENGCAVELLGTIQDITQQKEMDQKLRNSEQSMASILNNTQDAIIRTDRNFRHIFANPSLYRATGLSEEQYIGKTNREAGMPDELCVVWQEQTEKVFRTGEPVISEFGFLTKHKGDRVFQAVSAPEFNEAKEVETMITTIRDITDLKQAEAEKSAMIAKLEKALAEVNTLRGLIPICSHCKKIRDDKGYWNTLETYIEQHSDASFSHSLCRECSEELYGKEAWYITMKKKKGRK